MKFKKFVFINLIVLFCSLLIPNLWGQNSKPDKKRTAEVCPGTFFVENFGTVQIGQLLRLNVTGGNQCPECSCSRSRVIQTSAIGWFEVSECKFEASVPDVKSRVHTGVFEGRLKCEGGEGIASKPPEWRGQAIAKIANCRPVPTTVMDERELAEDETCASAKESQEERLSELCKGILTGKPGNCTPSQTCGSDENCLMDPLAPFETTTKRNECIEKPSGEVVKTVVECEAECECR